MKKYMVDAVLGLGIRDEYFRQTLDNFIPAELNILQLGAIEEPKRAWRQFSGWSDIFFASYISTFGGRLDVVDFNQDHLDNSRKVLGEFDIDFELHLSDGSDYISNTDRAYDLVYLDAGNCPDETKKQYDLLDKDNISLIIVDDFHIKGKKLEIDKSHRSEFMPFKNAKDGMLFSINTKAYEDKFMEKDWAKMKSIRDESIL